MFGSMSPGSPTITSRSNPRIVEVSRLRERRQRERTGLTLIDGTRELLRALQSGAEVETLYVLENGTDGPDSPYDGRDGALEAVRREAKARGAEIVTVSRPVLERVAFGERAEGVVGVARVPDLALDRISLPENALVVVIESVEKPGNLGAVLRSADAVGAAGLVAADARTDIFNPNVIRASLGTVFSVPVASGSTPETIAWLREHGLGIVTARVDAAALYSDLDLRGPLAIVLGSEAHGLSDSWRGDDVTAAHLPMHGAADSLNVSTTAAVLLYEATRQRGLQERSI